MAQDIDDRPQRVAEPPYLERKEKPDGTIREYRCTRAYADRGLVVVRFPMQRGGSMFGTPVGIPPGSVSFGFFWAQRPYNLYRMLTPAGEVICHRFDAVADVRIEPAAVTYRDLVLDWWALPDDTLIAEDDDEFEQLVESGALSPEDQEQAQEAARAVYGRYRHIIDRAAAFLARQRIRP